MTTSNFSRRTLFGATAAASVTAKVTLAPHHTFGKGAVADAFVPAQSRPLATQERVQEGVLGRRLRINRDERLKKISVDDILAPYQKRPGAHAWAGEHVGKFLHAAVLSLQTKDDASLRQRLDNVAHRLIASQLKNGYLGTYAADKYWTGWDVWSHKYNLLGLLAYHDFTGNAPALQACRKASDLLCRTFGKDPGMLDIVSDKHSTHMGMASTSVLEPMVLMYRRTGVAAYRKFCDYLLTAWEQPNGPKLLSSLLSHGNVHRTANAKAYEMLSNMVGMCELHRTTGQADLLRASVNAWQDIVLRRQYVIGTTSWGEEFKDDYVLPASGGYEQSKFVAGGEGCVTTTWLQLNWQLLRLTGDAKYADILERTAYNALIGAQDPHTGQISYFSPLVERKRYGEVNHGITPDVCCCASSIPRGIGLLWQMMAGTLAGHPAIVFYEPAMHEFEIETSVGKQSIKLTVLGDYPRSGQVRVQVQPRRLASFTLVLRVPAWAQGFVARVGDKTFRGAPGEWLNLERDWGGSDEIEVDVPLALRQSPAGASNPTKVIVERGPQVLATDENVNALGALPTWGWSGNQIYEWASRSGKRLLVPFSDAGQTRAEYTALL